MYPLRKVMIFIDAGYLRGLLKPFFFNDSEIEINFKELVNLIYTHQPDNSEIIRIYYYDGLVDPAEDIQKFKESKTFQAYLKNFGLTARTGRIKNSEKGARQKGVDVLIATDMISKAHKDHYDIAFLLAGDDDFLDVVEAVKNDAGKRVYGVFSNKSVSRGLKEAFDQSFIISDEDLNRLKSK